VRGLAALSNRDIRALKILAAFLAVVGLVALYIYVFLPQQERLTKVREDLQTVEMQLRADLTRLNKASTAEADMKAALEQLRAEEALICDEDKQAFFIRDVEEMAKKSSVKVNSMRFTDGKAIGRFNDIATIIEVTGSYAGVKSFYDYLEVLNRKLAVRNFSFDLQSEVVAAKDGSTTQKDVLHSICNLSLFIRPKGGVQGGSAK